MSKWWLSSLLVVDGALALGFGLISGLWPRQTFGTIVQLQPAEAHEATVAALTSLSLHYSLIGLVCLTALKTPAPYRYWLALVMLARHLVSGAKGYAEVGAAWQIGNPWPDLVIHGTLVMLYAAFIGLEWRSAARRT